MAFEEDSQDEDISIDFSKIKNVFKRKKKEAKSEEKPKEKSEEAKPKKESEQKEDDDEISIDFKKIKNFFKGSKEKKPESDEEEIAVDIKKVTGFFSSNKKVIVPVILIIICIFFSIYLRIQPAYMPITDSWAQNAVYNQVQSNIKTQISQQYPNLPEANKDSLVNQEFQKVLKEQKTPIQQQIGATSAYFKTHFEDDKGQAYLTGIDPDYWMRHTQNILKNGHPGDELRDGKPYDAYMYAPLGRPVPPDMLHAYFQAYLYRFLHFFNRNLELMAVIFYVPILLCALNIIPAFFIGRRLGGNFAGFIAAFIVGIHPAVLARTIGGFSDTDPYTLLLPLLITWTFLEAFEAKSRIKMSIYSAIAGFFVGLFSFAWGGWFYIFDFILAASVFYLVYYVILHRNELKKIKGK